MDYQPILSRFPNTGIKVTYQEGKGYIASLNFLAKEDQEPVILKYTSWDKSTEKEAVDTLLIALEEDYERIARLYTDKIKEEPEEVKSLLTIGGIGTKHS